jgi:hypothetical protein
MSKEWDWKLTDTANRQFNSLDEYVQERISSKRTRLSPTSGAIQQIT